jgi:hypothetical protein
MIALGLSLLANAALLALVGLAALESEALRKKLTPPPAPPAETVATIFPEMAAASLAPPAVSEPPPPAAKKRFARTSEDQAAARPERSAFHGERNTQATSDKAPTASAPALPSQAGIEPRDEADIETTESDYQDGSLAPRSAAAPDMPEAPATPPQPAVPPAEPAPPRETTAAPPKTPGPDATRSVPPPRENLLSGPNPVDVQVPRETADAKDEIRPTPEQRPAATAKPPETKPAETAKPAEPPKPKPSQDPAFKGFQRKTAVMGSISRTGRSALDVADSPLGRYQAAISRAVELEWQRNCVRHRDFITPGFLTVRFFVETSGKVRSVQFVGDMETGEVQKGFTLNSIRDAEIPAMPAALRREYDKEPLELIFRFYF